VYQYDPFTIGLVLFSFGAGKHHPFAQFFVFDNLEGQMSGSLLGGRWSDHVLAQLRIKEGTVSPEVSNTVRSMTPFIVVSRCV
jgi:hypothetical protein